MVNGTVNPLQTVIKIALTLPHSPGAAVPVLCRALSCLLCRDSNMDEPSYVCWRRWTS